MVFWTIVVIALVYPRKLNISLEVECAIFSVDCNFYFLLTVIFYCHLEIPHQRSREKPFGIFDWVIMLREVGIFRGNPAFYPTSSFHPPHPSSNSFLVSLSNCQPGHFCLCHCFQFITKDKSKGSRGGGKVSVLWLSFLEKKNLLPYECFNSWLFIKGFLPEHSFGHLWLT